MRVYRRAAAGRAVLVEHSPEQRPDHADHLPGGAGRLFDELLGDDAAAEAARAGVRLMIEPINTRDMPGFFLNRQDHAHELLEEIGADNVQVQMDLYHCQIVEGDVASKIRRYLPTGRVGHFQIAGVPERHEPEAYAAWMERRLDEGAVLAGGCCGTSRSPSIPRG